MECKWLAQNSMCQCRKCPYYMSRCVVRAHSEACKFAEAPLKVPTLSASELAAVLRGDFCNRLCSDCPLCEVNNIGDMDCIDVAKRQAARMLDKMATKKDGWISVYDKLPDSNKVVFARVDDGKCNTVRSAYISSYGEWKWIDRYQKVTYWRYSEGG